MMPKGKPVKRSWAVYCSDGELWEGDLSRLAGKIELALADAECEYCEGPHELVLQDSDQEGKPKLQAVGDVS